MRDRHIQSVICVFTSGALRGASWTIVSRDHSSTIVLGDHLVVTDQSEARSDREFVTRNDSLNLDFRCPIKNAGCRTLNRRSSRMPNCGWSRALDCIVRSPYLVSHLIISCSYRLQPIKLRCEKTVMCCRMRLLPHADKWWCIDHQSKTV